MKEATMAVRYFGERESAAKRGLQVWMVLVAAARQRQTLRYADLRDALRFGGAGVFAGIFNRSTTTVGRKTCRA